MISWEAVSEPIALLGRALSAGDAMGASGKRFHFLSEPLESRQLLSISPIQPVMIPTPVPAGAIFFGPEIRFAAFAQFQNGGYASAWERPVTAPAVVAPAPAVAESTTGVMILVLDNSAATTFTATQVLAGNSCWDSPVGVSGGDTERNALQTNLASLTTDNDIDNGNDADATIAANVTAGADGTGAASAAAVQTNSVAMNTGQPAVVRTSGTGGRAQPGLLHPSPTETRDSSTASDRSSSDDSNGSGGRGPSGDAASVSASTIVDKTQAVSAGGAVAWTATQNVTAGWAEKATSGLTQSVFSSVNMVMKPLAGVTFSVLPLAIGEMSTPTTAVDPTGANSAPQAFARAAGKGAAVALHVANAIFEAPVAPVRAALVNLFHVDAISTFSDAMGAFIDESAAKAISRGPTSHSRAWKVTAAAAAADLLLVGYWLAARRQGDSVRRRSADSAQDLADGDCSEFCGTALSPR
jgi:hypothetical protein